MRGKLDEGLASGASSSRLVGLDTAGGRTSRARVVLSVENRFGRAVYVEEPQLDLQAKVAEKPLLGKQTAEDPMN